MELFVITSIILITLAFYFYFMKNTVFGISLSKGVYPGFFFFWDYFVFIIPSCILLNVYPIEHFWVSFKVNQELVFWISVLVLITYLIFLFVIFMVSCASKKNFFYDEPVLTYRNEEGYRLFVYYTVLVTLLLIFIVWIILGIGHTFTLSVFFDVNVSEHRYALQRERFTSFLRHYFTIISPFLAALIASPLFKNRVVTRVFLLFSVFFIASWGGAKGSIIMVFLVYFVAWATFKKLKLSLKSTVLFVFFVFTLTLITYKIVVTQYPKLTDFYLFFDYLYQRIFVAQMIGVYEQFSLHIMNSFYFFHGVPFASFFIDFPVFHKDLMMITEDRIDPSNIGIKNTYFIAEAYAMGGWLFILPAVIIYAVNFALSYLMMLFALNKFLVNNPPFNKIIVSIFLFSYLSVTGGFSDLMLFKIMIMLFILLAPIFLIAYFSRFKLIIRKGI